MANTVTVTVLRDGTKRRIIHAAVLGDGSGNLSNAIIYNYSADTNLPAGSTAAKLWVEYINFSLDPFTYTMYFDGTTPFQIWSGGNNGLTHGDGVDFRTFGGIKNNAVTPNGNITLSTTGLAANDHLTMIIGLKKG